MKLKSLLNYAITILTVIFIMSLIFVPLHYFSIYGTWIISIFIILFVFSVIFDLFYFAKETPNRKWGKSKTQTKRIFGIKRKTFFSIVEWIGMGILLIILIALKNGSVGSTDCPDIIQGNTSAPLTLKYFYSPFCPYCWKEEPVLRDLLKTKGNLFSLERYDIRYCKEEVNKYKISGTPSFVFGYKNKTAEFTHYGYLDRTALEKVIDQNKDNQTEG